MASHPYISGAGNISQMIGFLRKNFPPAVTSETVKKFQLAPNNESYVINALQFIGVIDEEGKRTEKGHSVLLMGENEFPKAFEELIRVSYEGLFELYGDDAWNLTKTQLVHYFRTTDKTSEVIGTRQAAVFQAFRVLAGHEQVLETKVKSPGSKTKTIKAKTVKSAPEHTVAQEAKIPISVKKHDVGDRRDLALTVRIEINLPAEGSLETYDNIFKSIRANLIDE